MKKMIYLKKFNEACTVGFDGDIVRIYFDLPESD